MTTEVVTNLGKDLLQTTFFLMAPMLVVAMVVGLVIGIFQTISSIHEQTIAFLPKVLAVLGVFLFCLPWDDAHDDLLYRKFIRKSNKILSIKVPMEYLISFVNDLPFFMVVFFRIGGMLLFAPVFGNALIPLPVRIAIALMFAFILYPSINKNQSMLPSDIISYAFIVFKEIAIGAVVGFAASMIFEAFNMAGYIISNQIGLDTAMVFDPSSQTGEEESIISVVYNMIAILIFLLINGHHWFIKTTVQSFTMIPLGKF